MSATIRSIDYEASLTLLDGLKPSVVIQYQKLCAAGWRFWITETKRGYCRYHTKEITVPLWAKNRGARYYNWYFCHEMAHAIAGHLADHGPVFMAALIAICPVESIELEITYKPRNAIAAGIGQAPTIDWLDISADDI